MLTFFLTYSILPYDKPIYFKEYMLFQYMPESVKVSLYVTEQLDRAVERLVERGLFTTKTDVYQEALRRLLLEYREDVGSRGRGRDK